MTVVYPHLFSPLQIGGVTIRNRIMQSGHTKIFSHDGVDSARDLAYQVERTRGGIGLIVTGNRMIHPTSTTGVARFPWAYLEKAIESDRRITEAVHEHGAAIFAQLNHFGLNASSDSGDDLRVLWGPSAVKSPGHGETPKVMEPEDLREVADWWARAAECSREGGFDGVEVHLAHSYLLHQFLSPIYNKRGDEYGGSLENRLRFPLEVIRTVRDRVGKDFVVGVRLSLSDFIDGGLDIRDAIDVASALESTRLIDFITLTAAGYHNLFLSSAPSDFPDGWLVDLGAELKAAVRDVPVFTVGGLKDPAQAEEIIASAKADMVALTRAQIADPEWPKKVLEGREDEIYHCIRGNQGCISRMFRGMPISCTVNPAAGRERRFGAGTLGRSEAPARWLVVGGGPAGLKAAETLAKRSHEVVLLEKEERLGGQVNLILKTPGRDEFAWLVRDLARQLLRLGVDIRLGTEATPELVLELGADGVIVATGALPSRTGFSVVNPLVERLRGVDQENVLTVWDVLLERRPVGEKVVVLDDDGARYAAGVAEVLLDRGLQVEVVSRFNALFPSTIFTFELPILYSRLFEKGLSYRLNVWARRFDGRALTIYNLYTGAEQTIEEVDTLVLATGPRADDELYLALKGEVANLHRIGDCVAPRKLDHAIYEGYLAGRELWDPEERYIYEGELERWEAVGPTL